MHEANQFNADFDSFGVRQILFVIYTTKVFRWHSNSLALSRNKIALRALGKDSLGRIN